MVSNKPDVVKVVASGPEADIVCGLLRSNGIECGYRDAREILVYPADLEAARELLADS